MSNLIHPDDIPKRRKPEPEVEQPVQERFADTIQDTSGTLRVRFESGGRFNTPEEVLIKDYKATHISKLATTKEDKVLEVLVLILNELVIEPKGFDISELTTRDFWELMRGMKISFDSPELKYQWYHSCQDEVPDKQKEPATHSIDLRDGQVRSIEEVESELKESIRGKLESGGKELIENYMITKYGKINDMTIDDIVNDIKLKTPIVIKDYHCDYEFDLMRVKHLIQASKICSKEFDRKISIASNRVHANTSPDEQKADRQEEVESLNREKAERFITVSNAMCLTAKIVKGERIKLETNEDKLNELNSMGRNVFMNYMKAFESIDYGIDREVELYCDVCGSTEPDRGYLRSIVNTLNLIPVSMAEKTDSKRKLPKSTGFDFYI